MGLLFFQLLGLNQHSYPMGPFSCLPHSPACSLNFLSTVPTNCREGFGGEKNQPAQPAHMGWRENAHGDGRLKLLLLAQLDRCPGGPSSSWLGWKDSPPFLFFMSLPCPVSPFFLSPYSMFPFPLPLCFHALKATSHRSPASPALHHHGFLLSPWWPFQVFCYPCNLALSPIIREKAGRPVFQGRREKTKV